MGKRFSLTFPLDRGPIRVEKLSHMEHLTFIEAARLLRCSLKTVYRHVSKGLLTTADTPQGRRIERSSVEARLSATDNARDNDMKLDHQESKLLTASILTALTESRRLEKRLVEAEKRAETAEKKLAAIARQATT